LITRTRIIDATADMKINKTNVRSHRFIRPASARPSSWIRANAELGAFRQIMRDDRERLGLYVASASWLLGVSVSRDRESDDGEGYPSCGERSRLVDVFEWPRGVRWNRLLNLAG
jgi:hypothetical protein